MQRSFLIPVLALLAGSAAGQGGGAPKPEPVVHYDVQYAEGIARDGRRNSLDVYLPPGVKAPPLVMFVHGGGWSAGHKDLYEPLGVELCRRGLACATINTRMFPFVRPTAMAQDCARAFGYLHAHANELGFDGERMFLMGHSAGAHLVSWVAVDQQMWALTRAARSALRGVIALSGVYDARPRHGLLEKVFGEDSAERAAQSPALRIDLEPPPFAVWWAQMDISGIDIGSGVFAANLRRHGARVASSRLFGCDHVSYIHDLKMPGGGVLVPRVADFVQQVLDDPKGVGRGLELQEIERERLLLGVARFPAELFRPKGAARKWGVLATDGARLPVARALARELARRGALVAVFDCRALDRLPAPRALEVFEDSLTALAAAVPVGDGRGRRPFGLAPLIALGDAGWLVRVTTKDTAGRLLLGSAAGASVTHTLLDGKRAHGLTAAQLQQAGMEVSVLLSSSGDAPAARRDAARLFPVLRTNGDLVVDLDAPAVTELLAPTAGDVGLLPFVAAFLDV